MNVVFVLFLNECYIASAKQIFATELMPAKTNGDKMKSLYFFTKNEQNTLFRYHTIILCLLRCEISSQALFITLLEISCYPLAVITKSYILSGFSLLSLVVILYFENKNVFTFSKLIICYKSSGPTTQIKGQQNNTRIHRAIEQ